MALPHMKKETFDWAVALNEHMEKRTSPAPEGWLNTRQIAKLWGLTTTTTSRNLGQMCKNGSAEMKKFTSVIAVPESVLRRLGPHRSYCRRTPYYRLIKKAPASPTSRGRDRKV